MVYRLRSLASEQCHDMLIDSNGICYVKMKNVTHKILRNRHCMLRNIVKSQKELYHFHGWPEAVLYTKQNQKLFYRMMYYHILHQLSRNISEV